MRPLPSCLLVAGTILATGCGGDPHGEPLQLTVPQGASVSQVVDTLTARGIVERGTLFRWYVRIKGADTEIRSGRYAFRQGESWGTIVDHLSSGRVQTDRLTIPEGFTLRQIVPRIARLSGIEVDSVQAILEQDSIAERLGVPGPGLEGYLFPDTYLFAPGTPPLSVLRTMTSRYRSYWTPEREARLDSMGLSEREAVTLASVVQAEARVLDEMPMIAGVYWNRVQQNHPLQADPTVLYALGGPRERLLYAAIDSVADNPYNTYTQPGLPPGPIGSPGARALDAALAPADTDFFYFVARPTGEHVFTETLAAHNRAKASARREWDTARAAVGVAGPETSDQAADSTSGTSADTTGGPDTPGGADTAGGGGTPGGGDTSTAGGPAGATLPHP